MGDRRVYVDEDGQQYYLDEDGEIVYIKTKNHHRIHPNVQAAIITAIGGVVVAIIALFPVNPPSEPYRPVIVAVAIAVSGNSTAPTNTPNVVNTLGATQPPIVLVTSLPYNGISQCVLQGMINATSSVADLIVSLENYYGIQPSTGGDWSNSGFVINGPSVFWTDLLDKGENLPSNVSRIRTQGNWGVFLLQPGGSFTIASPNGGGRFLKLTSCAPGELQDPPEPTVPTAIINTPTDSTNEVKSDELNAIFGVGNWFCFPHTTVEVAYRNSLEPIAVNSPMQYIDYWGIQYTNGQTVPSPGGATVRLSYPIRRTECPENQQSALAQWDMDSRRPITRDLIDDQLGPGKWMCTNSRSIDIINQIDTLTVQYPFNSLDTNNLKYGVGDTVSNVSIGKLWGFIENICT